MTITTAAAKHIMNSPETLVSDSLQGLCYTNPNTRVLEKERVVYYAKIKEMAQNQVTLISGGGSGHEPGYAGFVGEGSLAASVCGHVFSSPSSSQVLAAIEKVQSSYGTLVIIMNYTGDCLNFGLAVERAKAKGIKVELVAVEDDVAIGKSKNQKVGRRGMAATALVIKLAGALASKGAPLEKVRDMVQYAIDNTATLGVAFDHCHVPGSSLSTTPLGPQELELGMGIHNEPGFLKTNMMPAKQLVTQMMDMLIDQKDPDRSYLKLTPSSSSVVLLVNNLGGTAMLELNVVVKEAVDYVLGKTSLVLERVFVGPFVTSLNMPGFSITLLVIQDDKKDVLLDLLDQRVSIPAWPSTPALSFTTDILGGEEEKELKEAVVSTEERGPARDPKLLESAIMGATQAVIAAEPKITEYDTILGDGDCGQTLKTAALAVQAALDTYDLTSAPKTILGIAETIQHAVGGTSSAIYCIFLNALASGLLKEHNNWVLASNHALNTLKSYTKARVGDRTLMDTLCPFIDTLNERGDNVREALKAAQEGAKSTCHLSAKLGRSSYLDNDQVLASNLPDAGAFGLSELLTGLVHHLSHPTNN